MNTTIDTIATYSDGSGTYTITRDGNKMTTTIGDGKGWVAETFEQFLTRAAFLDAELTDEFVLTDRFASTPDIAQEDVVWVDGLAYFATWGE